MRRLALALLVGLGLAGEAWSQGNCSVFKTFINNEILTASDLNSSLTQGTTVNSTLQCVNDYSTDVSQMRLTVNPQSESLATSGAGEIERLRYQIRQLHGQPYWYSAPTPLNPPGDITLGVANSRSNRLAFYHESSAFAVSFYSDISTQAQTYFWPTALPTAASQFLTATTAGRMSWAAAGAGSGAWIFEGSATTENTTTSTTVVNITEVTISVAAGRPLWIIASLRKTTGAATEAQVGLALSGGEVRSPIVWSGATNVAEQGWIYIWVPPRQANYLRGFVIVGSNQRAPTLHLFDFDTPNATLTNVVLRGLVGNGAVTMGVGSVHVYSGQPS